MSRLSIRLTIWCCLFLLALNLNGVVFAQADALPKTENITVSASVQDNVPPTTPILIAPEDNSYLTSGYITFVWKGSSDENGIKEYELLIDGSVFITDIPPNDAETTRFTLTYDPSTDYYYLKTKELIPDGTHTWKIIAIDNLENGTGSATWSFTIDTRAPTFIVFQVGEVSTTISAQDINTVPTVPIELDENQPQLLGNGEANSTVDLIITIPGDPVQILTHTTDINGNWGEILGILPRDTVVRLDFTITDQAGLISVINNVQLIIKTQYFVFPPASPSPSPSPIPRVSPPPSYPPTSPIPTSPISKALIAIPLTPPIEIAHEIIQETIERLPAPIQEVIDQLPTKEAAALLPWGALIILIILILWALIAMWKRFGKDLSPRLVWSTLQALGFFSHGKPQGLVYDSQTHQGVAFAKVEVRDEHGQLIDLAITDKNGIYRGLILKPGKYQIVVFHPDYQFPTQLTRPAHLTLREFYLGELFEVTDQYADHDRVLYLIPADQITQNQVGVGRSLITFNRWSSSLFYPLFIATAILTIIFPTVWNILITLGYMIQAYYRSQLYPHHHNLSGVVIDETGNKTSYATIGVINPQLNQFAALTQSQLDGSFQAKLKPQAAVLNITKPDSIWLQDQTPVSEYNLEISKETKAHLIITLKTIG